MNLFKKQSVSDMKLYTAFLQAAENPTRFNIKVEKQQRQQEKERRRNRQPVEGNNRKSTEGRLVVATQTEALAALEKQPQLLPVSKVVRGKGGRKKTLTLKRAISLSDVAEGKHQDLRFVETDTDVAVVVTLGGRTQNTLTRK